MSSSVIVSYDMLSIAEDGYLSCQGYIPGQFGGVKSTLVHH